MKRVRLSWFLTIVVVLCFSYYNFTEGTKHEKKFPSAVVVGSVYCDTCFQLGFSKTSHFISGASVAVECAIAGTKPNFREEVKTNEQGEFKVHLPFTVTKRIKKIKKCSVKLISSSNPNCAVASLASSSSLHLKSRNDGVHIFSAGFFTFKPPKQPKLCKRTPKIKNSKKVGMITKQQFPFPNPFQPPSLIPPNPLQPPSLIPPNPLQPPSLFPPNPFQPPPSILPNPFQPPPSIFPPNPLLPPSPPPSIFPPNPFQPPRPPPSIFPPNPFLPPIPPPPSLFPPFTLPPLPGLTPSPPPPSPPPPFSIHLPPFPFQPAPGFPGIPPASSSSP